MATEPKTKKTGIDHSAVRENQSVLARQKSRKKDSICQYYTNIPRDMEEAVLCSGVGLWPECQHYALCVSRTRKKKIKKAPPGEEER